MTFLFKPQTVNPTRSIGSVKRKELEEKKGTKWKKGKKKWKELEKNSNMMKTFR